MVDGSGFGSEHGPLDLRRSRERSSGPHGCFHRTGHSGQCDRKGVSRQPRLFWGAMLCLYISHSMLIFSLQNHVDTLAPVSIQIQQYARNHTCSSLNCIVTEMQYSGRSVPNDDPMILTQKKPRFSGTTSLTHEQNDTQRDVLTQTLVANNFSTKPATSATAFLLIRAWISAFAAACFACSNAFSASRAALTTSIVALPS